VKGQKRVKDADKEESATTVFIVIVSELKKNVI